MDLRTRKEIGGRFNAYVGALTQVIGHADRNEPLRDYCAGLLATEGRRRDLNPDGRFWRPPCCHYITPVYQTADSNRADGVHSAAPYHPISLSGRDGSGPW